MLVKLDFVGNPYVGVYCSSSDELLVVSSSVSKRSAERMSEALGTQIVQTTVGGSTVVGSLMRLNSHGVIVTDFITDKELLGFRGFNVLAVPYRLNAMGNNVLCNDRGALVHPGYDRNSVKAMGDVLGVEVVKGTIAGIRTVGSWGVATNKGVLCHPHAREEERRLLEEVLKVPAAIATANYGTAQIGACVVANSKGAVIGSRSTPIEIGRIEDGLGLY